MIRRPSRFCCRRFSYGLAAAKYGRCAATAIAAWEAYAARLPDIGFGASTSSAGEISTL